MLAILTYTDQTSSHLFIFKLLGMIEVEIYTVHVDVSDKPCIGNDLSHHSSGSLMGLI